MTLLQLKEILDKNAVKVKTQQSNHGGQVKYCRLVDRGYNSFILASVQQPNTLITAGMGTWILPLSHWLSSVDELSPEDKEKEPVFVAVEMRSDKHSLVYYHVDEEYLSKFGPFPKNQEPDKKAPFYVIPLIQVATKDIYSII